MAPTAKEPEVQNSGAPAGSPIATQSKVQPVALEIAVTVNGARTVEGSDKREPFSETTQTVLVFGSGAVIRLNSNVASGQLLFLTNEKTKKEVVCQVVKSKNYRSMSGYVELEFTEPAVGFWGMRFPTDKIAPTTNSATPIAVAPPKSAPVATSNEAPAAVVVPAAKPVVPPRAIAIVARPNPTPEPVNAVPAVVEKTATPAASADSASEELRKQTARLQEQLSSMLFEETPATKPAEEVPAVDTGALSDASGKVLEFAKAETPASTVTPIVAEKPKTPARVESMPSVPQRKPAGSMHDEEVKIPSWLEPLARNAGTTPVPPSSAPLVVAQAPPAVVSFTDARSAPVTDNDPEVAGETYEFGNKSAVTPVLRSSEQSFPSFGSELFQNNDAATEVASGGSKKGLWIGLAAATVLLAGGGGWWYTQQSTATPANTVTGISRTADSAVTRNGDPEQKSLASTSAPPSAPLSTKAISTPNPIATSQPANVEKEKPSVSLAVETQRIPSTRETSKPPAVKASTTAGKAAEPVEETRKTSFSQLRLAAPKVNGRKPAYVPPDTEPGIALESGASSSALNGGMANSHRGPAAPVPVGGEVKSVQLISSVQPVYPQMARSQHVSGDVKIDALIDENGRVTGMKVVSGPVLLHQAAMDALRQWKYRPATLDGKPVSMHLVVTIQFRLQ